MSGRKKGSKNKCKSHVYTKEQKQFLKKMCKIYDVNKLTAMFNKKFKLKKTKKAIVSSLKRYGFKTGRTGQFHSGQTPVNKGKKITEYMSEEAIKRSAKTRFKKGNVPSNHRPVGSERISKDGYIEVKILEPNKWEMKHRIIYEKNKGLIPKGYIVIFLDQDKNNLDFDNLELISRSQLLIANQKGLIKDNPELTTSGILVAKVIDKTNKLNRGDKNEK